MFTALICMGLAPVRAQQSYKAVAYLEKLGREINAINLDSWDYMSELAHGRNARNAEAKRKELLRTSKLALDKVSKMPDFNGSTQLRDSVVSFLRINYIIMNEDFGKILDMEAIAEQSYDNMEAYLLAKELANRKLDSAADNMEAQQRAFAISNGINLIENKDKIAKKMEKIGDVIEYYNRIYLIFFKSRKQEAYLVDAMTKKDINGMEQNRNALSTAAAEGLQKIQSETSFRNDKTLLRSCRDALLFFQAEADTRIKGIIDFYIHSASFEKLQQSFETKPKNERTSEDVNQYNAAVAKINGEVNDYNRDNNDLNNNRTKVLTDWDKSVKNFMARYIPKYKL